MRSRDKVGLLSKSILSPLSDGEVRRESVIDPIMLRAVLIYGVPKNDASVHVITAAN